MGAMATEDREKVIRAAWNERGRSAWIAAAAQGLTSIKIPESSASLSGQVHPSDLEFRFVRATMGGQPFDSIVCEGVVVESINPTSADWMNNSSDATNLIARSNADNQRRIMASISSGSTFVPTPPPRSQPMEAAGRAVAQGRATLSITFADKEAVVGWLNQQAHDVVVVFAARAALRVLPTMRFGSVGGPIRLATRTLVLRAFRAVATAWAVAAYPQARTELNNAARDALSGLGDIKAQLPVRAAVYAAATAAGASDVVMQHAATVIDYALDAAAAGGRDPFRSLLDAFAVDAGLLSDRHSPVTLANSQLWPGKITPVSIRDAWNELQDGLLAENEKWEVWTSWYERRLNGDISDPDLEIAKATLGHSFWEQDPKEVNAHLNEMTEEREVFSSALEQEEEEEEEEEEAPPDIAEIPRQTPAASQFVVNQQGELDLLPDPPTKDDAQSELYLEVRYKALALSSLGHNQLADVAEPVSRFLAALPEDYGGVSIARIWSRGNTLRQRLNAHDSAGATTDPTDPAILSRLVAAMLRDLVESYNIFIIGDAEGRQLDQLRLGPQERVQAQALIDLAAPIAAAIQESIGLATASAKETLREQFEAARSAPPNTNGDQSIELSRRTTGNAVVELVRSAYRRLLAEPGFALKEVRAGVYRAIGQGMANAYGHQVVEFVVTYAGNLKQFVLHMFQNPTLAKIIDMISEFFKLPG
jgi:hypothetical protein